MKRRVIIAIAIPAVLFLFLLLGPKTIQGINLVFTSQEQFAAKVSEYHRLVENETSLAGEELRQNQKEQNRVYYWLLARGHDIDGGEEETNILTPWRDLIRYWTGWQPDVAPNNR